MSKIKECKLALMEKDKDFVIGEQGEGNYIIRSSGSFEPEDYLKSILTGEFEDYVPNDEEYNTLIETAVRTVYETLTEQSERMYDTLGIWFTFEDGTVLDNAMDLAVLETMEELGGDDIVPVIEFAKMTLQAIDESQEGT